MPRNYRNKKNSFEPNHSQVEKAIKEYLKNGGKITKIFKIKYDPSLKGDPKDVDDFLFSG